MLAKTANLLCGRRVNLQPKARQCASHTQDTEAFPMKKFFAILAITASVAAASPSDARDRGGSIAPAVGVVTGTVVGLGLYHAWWHTGAFPVSAAGAATAGFVAGVGAAALIHAATTPCQGFHALFGNFLTSSAGCVNGKWVGERRMRLRSRG
jgi:hypothetical protein